MAQLDCAVQREVAQATKADRRRHPLPVNRATLLWGAAQDARALALISGLIELRSNNRPKTDCGPGLRISREC
jgi:hypothetical protein